MQHSQRRATARRSRRPARLTQQRWPAPGTASALGRGGACAAAGEAPAGTAILFKPVGAGPAGMHLRDCGVARLGDASEAYEYDVVRTPKDRLVVSRHGFCSRRRRDRARTRIGTLRAARAVARGAPALGQFQPVRRRARSPNVRLGAAEVARSHALDIVIVRAEHGTAHDRRLRQRLPDYRRLSKRRDPQTKYEVH
jgi:hypothetical protein